jgi:hypothetical protein
MTKLFSILILLFFFINVEAQNVIPSIKKRFMKFITAKLLKEIPHMVIDIYLARYLTKTKEIPNLR